MQVTDGTGTQYSAKVDNRFRLATLSSERSEMADFNIATGAGLFVGGVFNAPFINVTPASAGNTFAYLNNLTPYDFLVYEIAFGCVNAETLNVFRENASELSSDTAVNVVALTSKPAVVPATSTTLNAGATFSTGTAITGFDASAKQLTALRVAAATTVIWKPDSKIILGPNSALRLSVVTSGARCDGHIAFAVGSFS